MTERMEEEMAAMIEALTLGVEMRDAQRQQRYALVPEAAERRRLEAEAAFDAAAGAALDRAEP